MCADSSSNYKGCGVGVLLLVPDGMWLEYALCFNFHASSNEVEYEALLAGLRMAKGLEAHSIQLYVTRNSL